MNKFLHLFNLASCLLMPWRAELCVLPAVALAGRIMCPACCCLGGPGYVSCLLLPWGSHPFGHN